ncbi:hypothetical protein VTK73DRAFT_4117 [Phialemonium thermophilum]|uniref:Uncharacterized protein n=1 Tax=Phialemonium thermophilum TaxID=223376 RepID=A0ABR3WVK1_9PEZI
MYSYQPLSLHVPAFFPCLRGRCPLDRLSWLELHWVRCCEDGRLPRSLSHIHPSRSPPMAAHPSVKRLRIQPECSQPASSKCRRPRPRPSSLMLGPFPDLTKHGNNGISYFFLSSMFSSHARGPLPSIPPPSPCPNYMMDNGSGWAYGATPFPATVVKK